MDAPPRSWLELSVGLAIWEPPNGSVHSRRQPLLEPGLAPEVPVLLGSEPIRDAPDGSSTSSYVSTESLATGRSIRQPSTSPSGR